MAAFRERLKELMEIRGLRQIDISKATGISQSSLSHYIKGRWEAKQDTILKIAGAYNINPVWLCGYDVPMEAEEAGARPELITTSYEYTLLGKTAAGPGVSCEINEKISLPCNVKADYIFQVEGDSMEGARIYDGDIVFIRREDVQDGQICCVRHGDEYMIKRIYRNNDSVTLISENPKYAPIIIHGDQEDVELIGRAVYFLSAIR